MIRLFNRLLTLLFGVALLGGGILVIIEGIWTWTNSGFVWIPGHQWLRSFKTTAWSAPIVIAISAGVGALGLLLLLFEIRPQRRRVATYRTDGPGEWLLLRRPTERRVQRRVATQVPVSPIKARLNPRGPRWVLKLTAGAARSSAPALEAAGQAELKALHAPSLSRVRVKTTKGDS